MYTGQLELEINDLVIGYGGQPLCEPVNLSLAPGAGIGIIGSNGSGKSSLIRSVLGMHPAISGNVLFDGKPLDECSVAFRRQAAVQVTDGNFFEELTVAEHLEMVARGHGLPHWANAVAQELEFFDIVPVANNLPAELSSGQRRKLLLAAALIRPANLLVLDEPEQRLDLRTRQRFYERVARLRGGSVSVLAVTHDPQMLRTCLDSALLIDGDQSRELSAEEGATWLER